MIEAQLEQRLIALRKEYESGQKIMEDIELKLAELQRRKTILGETLLRISGAIDLLEEVLEKGEGAHELQIEEDVTAAGIVEVPEVIRQSLEKATKALESAGLTAGEIVEQRGVLPIGVMVGEVLRQDPKSGTKLPAGSAVKLIVAAKGKYLASLDKRSACNCLPDRK
jgi:hypothetical protein